MKISILFDNTSAKPGIKEDWGFSCFVETGKRNILFDTGADGELLLENMRKLSIDPKQVDDIFISHNHFDHIGGLSAFLNRNNDVRIFVPKDLLGIRKAREIIYVNKAMQLDEGMFSTGTLEEIEQSLLLKTNKGLLVIVGCAHPDMNSILNAASRFGKVFGIIGGLHGFKQFELFNNLDFICPTHCTQHNAEIKNLYTKQYVDGGAGTIISI
ncbi:MAG: MBL fold metallo-hydrolase [Calditrichaeota bacterium]|nr:MBL fold metallo-hydrolase [Calditrichota bacterium]